MLPPGLYKLTESAWPINPGERFRLHTRDPMYYPLSHPLLLDLHAMLCGMIIFWSLRDLEDEASPKGYEILPVEVGILV